MNGGDGDKGQLEKFEDLVDDNYRKQDICTVCTVVISSPRSGED